MKKNILIPFVLFMQYQGLLFSQNYTFLYFDQKATLSKNFKNLVPSGEDGFSAVYLTAQNLTTFNTIAPPNIKKVYSAINDKKSLLRQSLDRLTKISGKTIKTIEIRMINDSKGLSNTGDYLFCRSFDPDQGISFAWPCASNQNNSLGYVMFGEIAAGDSDFEAIILHEVSHTQTLYEKDGFNSKFGCTNGVLISYGGDKGHYKNELQGGQQAAMDEALGNYWAGVYDPSMLTKTVDAFNGNQPFLLGSHSTLTGTPDMWNAQHEVLVSTTVPMKKAGEAFPTILADGYVLQLITPVLKPGQSGYEARLYKFLDIPKDYIYYSEKTVELYLAMYENYAYQNQDTAMNKIIAFAKYYAVSTKFQRHRYPENMSMFFASSMEKYYKTMRLDPTMKSEKFVSSIFPLALYDLLMHFGLNETELSKKLETTTYDISGVPKIVRPRAADIYLKHRTEIKSLLCPFISGDKDCQDGNDTIDIDQAVQAIQKYCMNPKFLNAQLN